LALRQAGIASPEVLAERLGEDPRTLGPILQSLSDEKHIDYLDGRLTGWMLTEAGRELGEELLKAELDDTGSRAAVQVSYRQFRDLNRPFLRVCSDWQVRNIGGLDRPNAHDDSAYDDAVFKRLSEIHIQVVVVLRSLSARLERYGWYEAAFQNALQRLNDGDRDYFTKPLKRSYHSIWFELHEDLLATLNLNRASEGS
jgi:DNA-binding MarR family transcriptional regulator